MTSGESGKVAATLPRSWHGYLCWGATKDKSSVSQAVVAFGITRQPQSNIAKMPTCRNLACRYLTIS
jgi:hypothetical protein